MFPGDLISLQEDVAWPSRSMYLSLCDFFLWGYLEAEVFKYRSRTLEELKETIREKISGISKRYVGEGYGKFSRTASNARCSSRPSFGRYNV